MQQCGAGRVEVATNLREVSQCPDCLEKDFSLLKVPTNLWNWDANANIIRNSDLVTIDSLSRLWVMFLASPSKFHVYLPNLGALLA